MRKFLFQLVPILICCFGCQSQDNSNLSSLSSTPGATSLTLDAADSETPDLTDPNALQIERLALLDFHKNKYIGFPSVGVKLICPDGYTKAEHFYGLENSGENASVMITVLPGSVEETTTYFTAEKLRKKGMELIDQREVPFAGGTGVLFQFSQSTLTGRVEKWSLVFGDEMKTTMVIATYPESGKELLSALLKKTVLSTKLDSTPPPLHELEMNFSVTVSDKLKLAPNDLKLLVGAMLAYTEDGVFPIKSQMDPLYIVVQTDVDSKMTDKKAFSTFRLHQTPHLISPSIISMKEIQVDGMEGYELLASALDEETRQPLMIYQADLFDENSSFLIHGAIGRVHSDKFIPEFKKMTYSIKRKN